MPAHQFHDLIRGGRSIRCTNPLGQRISAWSSFESAPRPKWARLSREDMNPTLVVTWLKKARPEAVTTISEKDRPIGETYKLLELYLLMKRYRDHPSRKSPSA